MSAAFTPLNVGETKTYRVEVRAVEEGHGYVGGVSYFWSEKYIHMYLDDETLFDAEHRERYPELHERPLTTRSATDNFMTDDLRRQLEELTKNPPPRAPIPTWEESRTFFTEWIIAEGYTIEETAGFLATDLFLSADRVREVLALAGFSGDDIDRAAPADNGATARSTHQSSFFIHGRITNEQIPYGNGSTTHPKDVSICADHCGCYYGLAVLLRKA